MSDPQVTAEARRWLQYAREDLAQAEAVLRQDHPVCRHACWFAQQAAEKSLKAALVFLQTEFPKTHDLAVLRGLLPGNWAVQEIDADFAALTEWAVESRYPGDWPETNRADAESAIEAARTILAAVLDEVRSRGLDT